MRVPSYITDIFKENYVNNPSLVISTISLLLKTNNKLFLFWNIVCSSIVHIDTCDCLLIFKLYEKYGKDVFDHRLEFSYEEYDIVYINGIKTISDDSFNMLCEEIDKYTNSYKS